MKKLILLCAAIGTLIAFANNLDSTNNQPGNEQLATIEATAACEVSSIRELNTGHCLPKFGESGDACVNDGYEGGVRCCGNTDD